MAPTEQAQEDDILVRRELRLAENLKRWEPRLSPQPRFGLALGQWVDSQFTSRALAAAAIGVTPETLSRWINTGTVPNAESRNALREAGFRGDFWPVGWSQTQFVKAELVRVRNSRWKPGDFEGREFVEKYAVTALVDRQKVRGRGSNRAVIETREEVEYLFSTRVSDVVGVISKGEVISDWTSCQTASHLVGEPVLNGTAINREGNAEPVEIRGSWRKIEAWRRKCLSSEVTIDHHLAHIRPGHAYTAQQLLDFHQKAYLDRYKNRDKAGEYGTRAHHLGHAWLKFHAYQDRDSNGTARINIIRGPQWFWEPDNQAASNELFEWDLDFEPLEVQQSLTALETFFAANELTVVETELLLADMCLGVAGACDCIARDANGDLIFLDWKTSGGVYPPMFIQLVWYARLYWLCRKEMPRAGYIIRLDKKTAEVEVVPVFTNREELQEHMEAALMAASLARWLDQTQSKLDNLKREANHGGSE